jgi:quercetin dioxygenase-like cupin family protein
MWKGRLMSRRTLALLGLILVASFALAGPGVITAQTPIGTPVSGGAVVREVLASDQPASAPGQELQLVRYIIPPNTRLATHTHPGVQLARIESGVLTYTVVHGEVPITRASGAGTPGPVEVLRDGQTTKLHPGDWVVERPGVVHYGWNQGSEPVVILATTLLTEGAPPSQAVNDLGTPTN